MRVLLIAYYFPPDGGPGAQRPISFARHLPSFDVQCTVLTRTPPQRRTEFDPADTSALASVEQRSRIVRGAPGATMAETLANLTAAGHAEIARERPDVVLVTMSPFELWRTAAELGHRHRVPVVFDLRDPWALDGVVDYRTWWHWRRALREMRAMLRAADGVVANTPECRGLFLRAEPSLRPERVAVVTNGWDHEEFAPPLPRVEPGELLRLFYGGSFICTQLYDTDRLLRRLLGWVRWSPEPLQRSGRTPLHLLRAIRLLRQRGEPAGREVRLCAMGQADPPLQRCVTESGVADAVELLGYQPHAAVVDGLRRADALFLTLHGLPPGHRSRIVPGKTYEYLASGRPILAGLPAGDAREFVAASPRAFVADPCDDEGLARQLRELHARWRAGAFVAPEHPPGVERFERRALAGELVAFLRRLAP
ncbi:MAG: glycosyltransferase [Planctomycetes bacterium]|nr:glycosyltransferase [Planctomycetota bacterium]